MLPLCLWSADGSVACSWRCKTRGLFKRNLVRALNCYGMADEHGPDRPILTLMHGERLRGGS